MRLAEIQKMKKIHILFYEFSKFNSLKIFELPLFLTIFSETFSFNR
jgi:hypothetical protein